MDVRPQFQNWKSVNGESSYNQLKNVMDIKTPEALTQIIGYVKYVCSSEKTGKDVRVYFRGQTKHHCRGGIPSLSPSLFRKIQSKETANKRVQDLNEFLQKSDKIFLGKEKNDKNTKKNDQQYAFPKSLRKPVLQQYGMCTDWLDVVDNVWTALWFASHSTQISQKKDDKQSVRKTTKFEYYQPSTEKYSYVYLITLENLVFKGAGFFEEKTTCSPMEIVDLRVGLPSIYLRPHSQHGLMLRRKAMEKASDINYQDHLALVLRIETKKILEWLGTSPLTSFRYLFPSPVFDLGYGILLHSLRCGYMDDCPEYCGSIAHVSG